MRTGTAPEASGPICPSARAMCARVRLSGSRNASIKAGTAGAASAPIRPRHDAVAERANELVSARNCAISKGTASFGEYPMRTNARTATIVGSSFFFIEETRNGTAGRAAGPIAPSVGAASILFSLLSLSSNAIRDATAIRAFGPMYPRPRIASPLVIESGDSKRRTNAGTAGLALVPISRRTSNPRARIIRASNFGVRILAAAGGAFERITVNSFGSL